MYWCVFIAALQLTTLLSGAAGATIISPQNPVQSISRSVATACEIKVYCQFPLSGSSTVTVNGQSVCKRNQQRTTYIDIDSGTTSISIGYLNMRSPFYRIVITEVPNTCSGNPAINCATPTGVTGFITSPQYPEDYANNVNCKFEFPAKAGYCQVQFKFNDFHLEDSNSCSSDSINISDALYCGEELQGKTVQLETPLTLTFKTNERTTESGFAAFYLYKTDCEPTCNKIYTNNVGYITPPFDENGKYKNNQFCNYMIEPNGNAKCVSFTSNKFEFEDEEDNVKIDGQIYNEITKLSETEPFVNVSFAEDRKPVTVTYFSNGEKNNNQGFVIKYQQIFDSTICPKEKCAPIMNGFSGQLKNPNYQNVYPKNFICEYTIRPYVLDAGSAESVTLVLNTKLPTGDILKITAPPGEEKELKVGKAEKVEFKNTGLITIEFQSDGNTVTKFSITVIQTAPTVKVTPTKPVVTANPEGAGFRK